MSGNEHDIVEHSAGVDLLECRSMLIAKAAPEPFLTVITLRVYGIDKRCWYLFIDAENEIHRLVIGK